MNKTAHKGDTINEDLEGQTDLMNRTESPAWSLLALTKTLQPVVSK